MTRSDQNVANFSNDANVTESEVTAVEALWLMLDIGTTEHEKVDSKVVSNQNDIFLLYEEMLIAAVCVMISICCIVWAMYKAHKLNSQAGMLEKRYRSQRETGIFDALEVRPSEDHVFSVPSLLDITTNGMIPPLMRPKGKRKKKKKRKHIKLPPIPQNKQNATSKSNESIESKTMSEPPKIKRIQSTASTETSVELDDTTDPTEITPSKTV